MLFFNKSGDRADLIYNQETPFYAGAHNQTCSQNILMIGNQKCETIKYAL
jgi:hypothetical protein